MDYLGEAGIGRTIYPGEPGGFVGEYPWTVAGCGDLDLIGDRKPQSYYRGVLWGVGPPVAAFVDNVAEGEPAYKISELGWPDERASWTWPAKVGKTLTARVYARTPRARLLLNGRELGGKGDDAGGAVHSDVPSALRGGRAGRNRVGRGRRGGRALDATAGRPARPPARLRLTPDRTMLDADGRDLCYAAVEVLDASGTVCPDANDAIEFAVEGPATLLAVGSGDPRSVERFQHPRRRAFQGRCIAVVKSGRQAGRLRQRAKSAFAEASVEIQSEAE